MNSNNKFKVTTFIALALILGACSAGGSSSGTEISSTTSTSIVDSGSSSSSEISDERYQIYLKALSDGFTGSYQEWLDSIKGADGTSILSGNNDPTGDVGRNGDVYVNTTSWDFFVRAGGTWTKVGNIMGAKGDKGDQGEPGQNGVDGQTPFIGTNGNWWIGTTDTGISATGPAGENGTNGTNGTDGTNGDDGLSAYEIYKKYYPGYAGTEFDWINDLALGQLVKTVTLNFDGGTTSTYKTSYFKGEELQILPTTTKQYYTFDSWLVNNQTIDVNYYVVDNITITAKWNIIEGSILITNATQLNNIRNVLNGTFILANDIDLGSEEWTPIGTNTAPFKGFLDGQGFTISNLKITESQTYVGLFGYNEGTIKNLNLDKVVINVIGDFSTSILAGAIIGYNRSIGIQENLNVLSGNIYIQKNGNNSAYLGGVIGAQSGGNSTLGVTINNFSNRARIEGGTTTTTGGIIGFVSNSSGAIKEIEITNSLNQGEIIGLNNVGGLVGKVGGTNISRKINIQNSINLGMVSGYENIGGLVGSGNLTTKKSANDGFILGVNNIGGLLGYSEFGSSSSILESFNRGLIKGFSATESTWYIGGLIGNTSTSPIFIENSFNSGNIVGESNSTSFVGGLVGRASSTTSIINSFNIGSITGQGWNPSYIGGLMGEGRSSTTITNSFNSGSIQGAGNIGGLIGRARDSLFVNFSINFGNVNSTSTLSVGAMVGDLPANNSNQYSYYSGRITSNGAEVPGTNFGTKVTDVSTFNLAFFTTTLGWDTEVWNFTGLDIANGVYPTLKNMPVVEPSLELVQLKQNLQKLHLGNFTLDFQTPGICEPTSCTYRVTSEKLYGKINTFETYAYKEGDNYRSMIRFTSTSSWSVSEMSEESYIRLANEILPFDPLMDHLFFDNEDGTFSVQSQNIKEFIIRDSIEDDIVSILVIPHEEYLTLVFEFNNGVKHTYKYLNYGTTAIDIPTFN
jgi:hypothetical protein